MIFIVDNIYLITDKGYVLTKFKKVKANKIKIVCKPTKTCVTHGLMIQATIKTKLSGSIKVTKGDIVNVDYKLEVTMDNI